MTKLARNKWHRPCGPGPRNGTPKSPQNPQDCFKSPAAEVRQSCFEFECPAAKCNRVASKYAQGHQRSSAVTRSLVMDAHRPPLPNPTPPPAGVELYFKNWRSQESAQEALWRFDKLRCALSLFPHVFHIKTWFLTVTLPIPAWWAD